MIRALEQALAAPLLGKRYNGNKRADVLHVFMFMPPEDDAVRSDCR